MLSTVIINRATTMLTQCLCQKVLATVFGSKCFRTGWAEVHYVFALHAAD